MTRDEGKGSSSRGERRWFLRKGERGERAKGKAGLRLRSERRSGIVLLEACVAIMLVGLVVSVVSLLLTRYARATDYLLNQRRVQMAAESCVERMRAGVLGLTDADFVDESGVSFAVRVVEAEGEWAPLYRVRIKAEVTGKHSRRANYELAAYVADPHPQGGG